MITINDELAPRERGFWLAMAQVPHVGPVRFVRLLDRFGSIEAAWNAPSHQLGLVLDSRSVASLQQMRLKLEPASLPEELTAKGIDFVTLAEPNYPSRLRHISVPPPVMYFRGRLPEPDKPMVAIVGTRRATAYGRHMAAQIATDLALAGVVVVSGLARGIDGFAHQGAVDTSGETLAVMASGVDIIYPSEHRNLAERITMSGAILSDYPPGTKPDAPHFPARNRIISGLCLGTIVIEAPERSGALITVDFAADQGREVFVLPGNVTSPASAGTNRLLRSGARAIVSAADVLEDLGLSDDTSRDLEQTVLPLTPEEQRILALVTHEPQHIDELIVAAGIPTAGGSALMTMLELKGLVANVGAQHYVAVRRRRRQS